MNKIFQQLALQAGLSHMPSNYTDMADLYKGADFELEKFAELIVQKCLDQCYNRGMNDELYAGQLKAAAYIEEYFGVED